MTNKKPFIFNPDEEPREMLIATFVIRQKVFEKIFKEIKEMPTKAAPQHFLIVGQRGMGKTTLLLRLKYAIEDDKDLMKYVLPIRFPEEQYQISDLPGFWEEIALYLEGMDTMFAGMNKEMLAQEKQDDYERLAFELLIKKLKVTSKKVVLFVDNIGELLHKFSDQENHRLREILMTCPQIQLIGASSEVLEYTFQYDKPFFEFFYQLKLEPLTQIEANNLMIALANNYNVKDKIADILQKTPHRIEILRRITGGVPRTMVLLFEIFIDYNDGSAFEDLEHLADKVLPLYKARMDSLKPQQQKIVDAMALAWEAISSSQILEQSKLYRENITSNQISSQLKQLEDNQLVEVVETGKRKKLYRIRERFFNIWYLMRNGRKQNKEQVLWLIRFLESWCTIEDLKELAEKQIDGMRCGKYSEKAAFYKAMALHHIGTIDDDTKEDLLKNTESYLIKTNQHSWAATIHNLAESYDAKNYLQRAFKAFEEGNIKKAEEIQLTAFKKNILGVEYSLGVFYHDILKDYDKAEAYYLKAVDKDSDDAMFNLAILYKNNRHDLEKAEKYYLQAIEKGNDKAIYNLAILYQEDRHDIKRAQEYYLKAVEKGNVSAINNLARIYEDEEKDLDKAEEYYLKAIERGNVKAINNLAMLYEAKHNDINKAEKYYLIAIEKGNVKAINNLAILYETKLNDINKAEKYYLMAIEKGNYLAINNLAILYETKLNDINKAEEYYVKAIKYKVISSALNLVNLYWENNKHEKALALCETTLQEAEWYENESESMLELLVNLASKRQYHFLLNEFNKVSSLLSKYMAPFYYVIAWYLKEEMPGEYEKAGSEIKETVDEIIKTVNDKQIAEPNQL